jgi:hypothetical protein
LFAVGALAEFLLKSNSSEHFATDSACITVVASKAPISDKAQLQPSFSG